MFSTAALTFAVVALLPLMIATAWWDLKWLRIPNWIVLAVFAVFLATGIWGLAWDVFLWRLLYAVVTLLIGFAIFSTGLIGGGDAKMAAALAPFIGGHDVVRMLVIYAVITLVLVLVLRLVMHFARHRETGWAAVDQMHRPAKERSFPMGLIFAFTVLAHFGAELALRYS